MRKGAEDDEQSDQLVTLTPFGGSCGLRTDLCRAERINFAWLGSGRRSDWLERAADDSPLGTLIQPHSAAKCYTRPTIGAE